MRFLFLVIVLASCYAAEHPLDEVGRILRSSIRKADVWIPCAERAREIQDVDSLAEIYNEARKCLSLLKEKITLARLVYYPEEIKLNYYGSDLSYDQVWEQALPKLYAAYAEWNSFDKDGSEDTVIHDVLSHKESIIKKLDLFSAGSRGFIRESIYLLSIFDSIDK